jgi:hypothetical protein
MLTAMTVTYVESAPLSSVAEIQAVPAPTPVTTPRGGHRGDERVSGRPGAGGAKDLSTLIVEELRRQVACAPDVETE